MLDIQGGNQSNGAKVAPYPKNSPPSDNQLWYLEYQLDGTFLVVSKMNGKVLDCGAQGQGHQLIVWDRHGAENQRFRMEGNYLVTMRGLVLDIAGANPAPCAPLCLWSRNNPPSANQQFQLEPAEKVCSMPAGTSWDFLCIRVRDRNRTVPCRIHVKYGILLNTTTIKCYLRSLK